MVVDLVHFEEEEHVFVVNLKLSVCIYGDLPLRAISCFGLEKMKEGCWGRVMRRVGLILRRCSWWIW